MDFLQWVPLLGVLGIGSVTRQELCHDVLHEMSELDSDFVVKMTLPEM
jgi:hypothetical protein